MIGKRHIAMRFQHVHSSSKDLEPKKCWEEQETSVCGPMFSTTLPVVRNVRGTADTSRAERHTNVLKYTYESSTKAGARI